MKLDKSQITRGLLSLIAILAITVFLAAFSDTIAGGAEIQENEEVAEVALAKETEAVAEPSPAELSPDPEELAKYAAARAQTQASEIAAENVLTDLGTANKVHIKIDKIPADEGIGSARADYIMSVNKNLSRDEALYLAQLFEDLASTRDYIDTETLMGIARLESGYKSESGEKYVGMMQVSLKYGTMAGFTEEDLRDPAINLNYAVSMLDAAHERFPDNLTYVLLSYNQGYYALLKKIESGAEIKTVFAEKVQEYADQIRALY